MKKQRLNRHEEARTRVSPYAGLLLLLFAQVAPADEVRVAVASNVAEAIASVAREFERTTGHEVILSAGSTGKHYAQIRHGAPFDVFLAADVQRAVQLEADGVAVAGSRMTYALGSLVLWSPKSDYVDPRGEVLREGTFRHLAIANPVHAPYGRAAREVLKKRLTWDELQGRIVRGENIGQAYQFVASGNAELGFVARSQIERPGVPATGSWWTVPRELHEPIEQQAVLITRSAAARAFLDFLSSDAALKILRGYGYTVPP